MIDDSIFTLLKSSAGVAAIVANATSPTTYRIYPLVIPQKESGDGEQTPCVVYQRVGSSRGIRYTATDNLVNATYQIDSYATTYRAAALLAEAVRSAIVDFSGTVGSHSIKIVHIENDFAVEDPDPGLYRISQTYSVWYV